MSGATHAQATASGTAPSRVGRQRAQGTPVVKEAERQGQEDGSSETWIFKQAWEFLTKVYYTTPFFPVLAICCVYLGCVDYLSNPGQKNPDWEDLGQVSDWYGPGTVLSWVWTVNCLIYDAYRDSRTESSRHRRGSEWYADVSRVVLTAGYAAWAIFDHIYRAWQRDLGPSFAAGRYISDKAFETITILYIIQWFPTYITGTGGTLIEPATHRWKDSPYLLWPCWFLMAFWVAGRLLTLLESKYVHTPRADAQLPISWDPVIPREYRVLTFVAGLGFAMLAEYTTFIIYYAKKSRRDTSTWQAIRTNFRKDIKATLWRALPFGFWLSLALLHSGLYGTVGPFRLTNRKFEGAGQVGPVILTVLATLLKYYMDIWKGICAVFGVLAWPLALFRHKVSEASMNDTPEPVAPTSAPAIAEPEPEPEPRPDGHPEQPT